MHEVRLWNRLCIPLETTWCGDLVVYRTENSAESMRGRAIPALTVEQNKGQWALFYCCFDDCRMLAYKISTCESRQQLVKSNANHRVEAGWTPLVSTRYTARLFHSLWRDPVGVHTGINICVRSHVVCGAVQQTCLTNISKLQKRCK